MGFQSGHLARVVLRATNGGNQIVNTLHYDLAGKGLSPGPGLQALANRFRDDVMTPWKACITPDWTIQPVEVIDEKDPLNPLDVRDQAVAGTAGPGTRLAPPSSEVIPIQLCAMATVHTAHIGRSFRGRIFLPPLWSDAQIDAGVVAGAQLGNYNAFIAAIPIAPDLSTWTDTTANLCVYSRTRRAANAGSYAEHATSITLDTTVRWLRSRKA